MSWTYRQGRFDWHGPLFLVHSILRVASVTATVPGCLRPHISVKLTAMASSVHSVYDVPASVSLHHTNPLALPSRQSTSSPQRPCISSHPLFFPAVRVICLSSASHPSIQGTIRLRGDIDPPAGGTLLAVGGCGADGRCRWCH